MSVLGEKLGEISGRITSVTMTAAGMVVTAEAGAMKEFVGAQATVTFGPAIDAAGETGPVTLRGVVCLGAGLLPFSRCDNPRHGERRRNAKGLPCRLHQYNGRLRHRGRRTELSGQSDPDRWRRVNDTRPVDRKQGGRACRISVT